MINRIAAVIATLALSTGLAVANSASADAAPSYGGWREMLQPGNGIPCQFEDSRGCVWDARHRGNGKGRSFVVGWNGKVHYVSHRVAHRSING